MNELIQEKRKKLAGVIQTARVQKGISKKDLGEMVGINENTVSRIESCVYSPNLDIFYKIAHALEITVKVNNFKI
jgi:ribosome-binding protein aMBF1 (putative translation factor)